MRVRIPYLKPETAIFSKTGTGKDYLFWSVFRSRRLYIRPGTEFSVMLSLQSQEEDLNRLGLGVSAFWLLTYLGGIGTRSHRGAGNFAIVDVKGPDFSLPFSRPTSVQELQRQLELGIKRSRELYNKHIHAKPRQKTSFDVLVPEICQVWILQNDDGFPWNDLGQAMDAIGTKLQLYRRQIFPIEERKIFGVPVMVQEYGKPQPLRIKGTGRYTRRIASPLHLHFSEIETEQGRKYVCVSTLFKTRWRDMTDEDYTLYDHIEKWITQEFSSVMKVQI